jgi:AraC-like DNA-binding protein
MKNGQKLRFLNCHSDQENRNDLSYKRIRMYTAQIQYYLYRGDPFSMYAAKASMEMLMATLCTMFDTREDRSGQEVDEETQEIMKTVIRYLDVHYPEKITLEEIAGMTGYNRTYISTLFHQTLGIRFYDYLMRLRLQKAIKELVTTDKPLTEIALYNGFSDLKSFNTRFREMLKILPSEYRMKMDQSLVSPEYYDILSIPASEPLIMGKLEEYMKI